MSNRAQIEAYMGDDGPETLEWEVVEAELRALWEEQKLLLAVQATAQRWCDTRSGTMEEVEAMQDMTEALGDWDNRRKP